MFDPVIKNKNEIHYQFLEYQTKRYPVKGLYEIIEKME